MASPEKFLSSKLKILLLGRFEVYVDGQILSESAIKGRKARSLLKLVAHQRQYQMVRDHAVDILWPDLEPDAANAQLYKALYHIRKAFAKYDKEAENWIGITDDLIRITPPGGLDTDIELFTNSARVGLKDNQTAELERAVSLYAGEFLPMDRYADWAAFPREHYRQLYLDVLSSLAEAYEKQGDLSEAAEMMRYALDKEPTLETAHCGLMRIFVKKGQPTRAFHQYEFCRQTLRDELGISPSPYTKKLLDDVAEGKPLDDKETDFQVASASGSSTPLIGRADACAAISQRIEGLYGGMGGSMVIYGEAGMGKTRLVGEVIQQARKKQLICFMGRNQAGGGNRVYGPFTELFKEILHHQPGMKNWLPLEWEGLIPGFSGKDRPIPHVDQWVAKENFFSGVHRFFCQLSLDGPAVIILEDLHASDQGTQELLAYLIRNRGRLPILYVLTLRNGEEQPLSGYLSNLQVHFEDVLELTPFTYQEHYRLLQSQAENGTVSKETAELIYQLSEGNPFYALELLFHYRENGWSVLSKQLQGNEILPPKAGSKNIPASISKILEQKLEKHSAAAHHLLYIAAVIGRKIPYKILSSIWKIENDEGGLFNALEEVLSSGILEEQGLDFSFRDALAQETIYASLCEARRQMLHKQIAEKILGISPETDEIPSELIAWHFLGAKNWRKAAYYLMAAGKHAENVYAYVDALQRYKEAYDILNKEIVQKVRGKGLKEANGLNCEILERIGDVLRACGQTVESYEPYVKAISLAEGLPDKNLILLELHRKTAVAAIFRKENNISKKHLDKAFELLNGEPQPNVRLLITQAFYLWQVNQLEEAYALAKKAFRGSMKEGFKPEASQACEILAMTCLPLSRFKEGLKFETELQNLGWSSELLLATDLHQCLGEFHVTGDQTLPKPHSLSEQVSVQIDDLRAVPVSGFADREGSPSGMAYSLARKSVLHTLMGEKQLGWQTVQEGLVQAMQAGMGHHCLRRLYAIGIWNRLVADDFDQTGLLIENAEKLLAQSEACPACILELFPWFTYYFLQKGDFRKAETCSQAISELANNTGNPIGRAVAAMIKSNFCMTELKWEQAGEYNKKAHRILDDEVPEAIKPPIADYLQRMLEQQKTLQQV